MPTFQHRDGERVHIDAEPGQRGPARELARLEASPDWKKVADQYQPAGEPPAAVPAPDKKPKE